MTDQLYRHIQKLVPGFAVGQEMLLQSIHTKWVKKEELLLTEGQICDTIYFVNSGCLYLFYEDKNEKQVIHFALPNWWITDYKTFPDGKPADFSIAAMEDSEISFLSRYDYEALLLQFPLLALYFNKIHERAYGAALLKQKTFATVSKSNFYHYFKTSYPDLILRIPHNIFASYIGVSPEVLKKLKEQHVS
jgi:CRP-like cAMP-binding protein